MATQYHVKTSIDGLLNLSNKKLSKLLGMNGEKARMELMIKQLNGELYIPSSGCEGFDPVKGCPGHQVA